MTAYRISNPPTDSIQGQCEKLGCLELPTTSQPGLNELYSMYSTHTRVCVCVCVCVNTCDKHNNDDVSLQLSRRGATKEIEYR